MARTAAQWNQAPSLPQEDYVDNRIYTDGVVFTDEQQRIFRKVWLFAGHDSEFPEPYSYRTMVRAGTPIFLIRGEDQVIRGFVNVCPHRGATLLRDHRGTAPFIQCMFHQWTFDDHGNCTGITRPSGYVQAGLSTGQCGLREIRTENRFGLIFVNFDDEALPLKDFLGSALDAIEPALTRNPLELVHFNRSRVGANWKHYQETNLDLYHEQMHFASRRTSMMSADYHKRRWRLFDRVHGMLEPLIVDYGRYGNWEARRRNVLDGLEPDQFFVISLFPNLTLIARSTILRIDTTIPIAPNSTVVEWRGLGDRRDDPAARESRVQQYQQFWGPFGRNLPEDINAIESVERSMRNGSSPFSLLARHEDLLANDDVMMRRFYAEWSRLMERQSNRLVFDR